MPALFEKIAKVLLGRRITKPMNTLRYTHWQDDDAWLGYLEEFPDYCTQGYSLEELKANLLDLYHDLAGGHIPHVRRVSE